MDDLQKVIRKNSLISGLYLGMVLLVLSIFSFYFITGLVSSQLLIIIVPIFLSVIFPILIVIFLIMNLRKKIGGYWDFKKAVRGIFIMFLLSYGIQFLGKDLIFAKLIEPNMALKTKEAMKSATISMLKKTGASQAQIDEKSSSIEKDFNNQHEVTIGNYIQSLGVTIIFIFVFALIFAALFKKDLPVLPIEVG